MTRAFFLPLEAGGRFCIHHEPPPGCPRSRGGLVYIHPFGEEMNKARRMAALQARRFAAEGYSVLQIDLYGCGDSSGELADARWSTWIRDVEAAVDWLKRRVPGPIGLWGLRLGATLACDVAREARLAVEQLVLWQPVVTGEQFLSQFLRLQLAGQMLAAGSTTAGVRDLRAQLAQGHLLEISGYDLHPDLAAAIGGLELTAMRPAVKSIHWVEIGPDSRPTLRPAAHRVVEHWSATGVRARATSVPCDPFWTTLEIAECQALLEATSEALRSDCG